VPEIRPATIDQDPSATAGQARRTTSRAGPVSTGTEASFDGGELDTDRPGGDAAESPASGPALSAAPVAVEKRLNDRLDVGPEHDHGNQQRDEDNKGDDRDRA
jgi:hypothetical protein